MRLPDLDTIVALVVFAILSTMVGMATTYPFEVRLVPLVIGVPAVLLAAWQLWVQMRTRSRVERRPHQSQSARIGRDQGDGDGWSREAFAVLWVLLFTATVIVGGLVLGGTVAVMATQRIWLRESWRTTAWGGACAFLAVHIFFERGFGLVLYHGWVAEWVR